MLIMLLCGACSSPAKEKKTEKTESVEVTKAPAPTQAPVKPTATPEVTKAPAPATEAPTATPAAIAAPTPAPTNTPTPVPSELQVHFIDVGQGDCSLVICDGEAMLIDAGGRDMGTTVQLYLKKQGVEALKYMVGTHPDADHIGGMDVVVYKFDCETIIMPDKAADTATYRDVMDTIANRNYKITPPIAGDEYTLGNATITILGPRKNYEDDNNCSVVLRVDHGDNSFLFTGDIENDAESDLVSAKASLGADVLKIAHHGSRHSTGSSFFKKVAPTYAVVSCAAGNDYGHPHAEVLNRLRTAGCQLFRTDEQGSIVATSDGHSLTWNCAPSDTWKAGEPMGTPEPPKKEVQQTVPDKTLPAVGADPAPEPETPAVTYILNTNSKKFHRPNCSSVGDMKEKNKLPSSDDRDTIVSRGYVPCKRCNP